VNFLIDAQLPPALAHWIVGQGHHAEHVLESGMRLEVIRPSGNLRRNSRLWW
jgi:hypothetical protein